MNQPSEHAVIKIAKMDILESLDLKPEEAFVLTRVNGQSTLKEISQIVGYPVEKVWGLLSRCVTAGVLDIEQPLKTETQTKPQGSPTILRQLDEEDKDTVLSKIPRTKRSEILLRHQAQEQQNHYEVLGVNPSVQIGKIREAYFQLAKSLHPDRFFGKDLGHYRPKLEELFDRITRAYDDLNDPIKRKVYDHSLKRSSESKETADGKQDVKLTGKTLIERIALGKKYFEMGSREAESGNGLTAANFYQMALQFDPDRSEYRKAMERMAPFINRKRAEDIFQKAKEKIEDGETGKAIELLEESLKLHPKKRECLKELPLLYLKRLKKLDRAKELGQLAVSQMKNDPDVHSTLAKIYVELKQDDLAKKEFKAAMDLDKNHRDAREGLDKLKGRS